MSGPTSSAGERWGRDGMIARRRIAITCAGVALVSPLAGGMTSGSAMADDTPYQCSVDVTSRNLRLTAVEKDGACAGFEVRDRSGGVVQSFNGWLGSGVLLSAA